jgi:hypothetical protein
LRAQNLAAFGVAVYGTALVRARYGRASSTG